MSEEIYINTGTSFQQQYTARQPAIGTSPVTAQYDAQGNASSQTPFTYTHRTPYTFRSPVNAQTPYIASAQQPYPYIANNQTPYPANAQQPYPYPANAQQPYPYQASAQQPYPYIANSQTPFTYSNRSPFTYPRTNVNGQQPFTYSNRSPFTYPRTNVNGQQPFTYQARTPFTYPRSNVNARQPSTYQNRQPFPYIAVAFSQQSYTFQQPAGTNVPVNFSDHSSPATIAWQIAAQGPSMSGYIVNRTMKVEFKLVWWKHTNNYGYAYWYVRRGTGTFAELDYVQAQMFGSSSTYTLDKVNWRLFEQWTFGNGSTFIFPDYVGFGGSFASSSNDVSTAGLTSGQTRENIVSKSDSVSCEEGFVITPPGSSRQSTVTIEPTAKKTNYPNLTSGRTHTGTINIGFVSCSWGGCFLAGSKILLENNTTKNIEDMEVGDTVIGKDGVINAVKELRVHEKDDWAVYTINGSLQTTGGHPLLSTEGWKSCNASEGQEGHPELNITELAVGDILIKDAGNANGDTIEEEVTTITVSTPSGTTTFYNLDVTDSPSGNDTYAVYNYIVHNK